MMPLSKTTPLMLVLSLTLLVASVSPAQAQDADLGQEVETFLSRYLNAASSGDTDTVRAALVDDGRFAWIEDGAVRYRGIDDVLKGLATLPQGAEIVTDLRDLEVMALGTSGAHAWGSFSTTIGSGEQAFSFGGAISFVLERSEEGWKLVGGHTSSSHTH